MQIILTVGGIVGLITGLAALAELVWKPFRRLVLHRKSDIERLEEKVDRLGEYLDGLPTASSKTLRAAYEEARRLQLEGYQAQDADRHREAIERFTRALDLAENDAQRAALHNLRGNSLDSIGEWSAAMDDFKATLRLCDRITPAEEADRARAAALGNLGLVYTDCGDLDQAERHEGEALQAYRGMDDPLGQANALGNLGNIYRKRGELDRAEEHFRQVLEIHQRFPNPLSQANALTALGNVYAQHGRLEQAPEHYEKAQEHYNRALKISRRSPRGGPAPAERRSRSVRAHGRRRRGAGHRARGPAAAGGSGRPGEAVGGVRRGGLLRRRRMRLWRKPSTTLSGRLKPSATTYTLSRSPQMHTDETQIHVGTEL